MQQTDSEFINGTKSAFVSNRTSSWNGLKQTIQLAPNTEYNLSGYMKLSSGTGTGIVQLQYTDERGILITKVLEQALSDNWTKLSGKLETGNVINDAYIIVRTKDTPVDFWAENISCVLVESNAETQRVVQNSGFEEADKSMWGNYSGTTMEFVSATHEGTTAAKLMNRSYNWHSVKQNVVLEQGKSYEISAWMKVAEGVFDGRIAVEYLLNYGYDCRTIDVSRTPETSNGWTLVKGIVTMPKGTITSVTIGMGTQANLSDIFVDDVNCEKVEIPVLDLPEGLLLNGTFESEIGWDTVDSALQYCSTEKYGGSKSALILSTQGAQAEIYQNILLENNVTYNIGAMIKPKVGTGMAKIELRYMADGSEQVRTVEGFISSGRWNRVNGIISIVGHKTPITNAKIVISTSETEFYTDSAYLVKEIVTVMENNLLSNSGFESVFNQDWVGLEASVDRVQDIVHSGSYAAKVKNRNVPYSMIRQAVTLQPGETYQLSAWVKLPGVETTGEFKLLSEFLADGSPSSSTKVISLNSNEWTYVKHIFTVPNGEIIGPFFEIIRSDSLGDFYLDDAALKVYQPESNPIIQSLDFSIQRSYDVLLKNNAAYYVEANVASNRSGGDVAYISLKYKVNGILAEQRIEVNVTAAGSSLKKTFYLPETGEITDAKLEIDCIGESKQSIVKDVVFAYEFFQNASFETQILDGNWKSKNADIKIVTEETFVGNYAAKINMRENNSAGMLQHVALKGGQNYKASAFVRLCGNEPTQNVDMVLSYKTNGVVKTIKATTTATSNGWTVLQSEFSIPEEDEGITDSKVSFCTQSGTSNFYVDNTIFQVSNRLYSVYSDLNADIRTAGYQSSGFLHGFDIDGINPPSNYITDIKTKWHRVGVWYGNWNRVLKSNELGLDIQCVISDSCSVNSANYDAQVTALVQGAIDRNIQNIYWDLFNEPGLNGPHIDSDEFRANWLRTYNLVKAVNPNAKIVGPSSELFYFDKIKNFLLWAKENEVLPNYISWHFSDDPYIDANLVNLFMEENQINGVQIMINEFMWPMELTTSANAWYVIRNERADIQANASNWKGGNLLCDILWQDEDRNWITHGRWWMYKRYADITGMLVQTTPSKGETPMIEMLCGKDSTQEKVRALLGKNGSEYGMDLVVGFDNIDAVPYIVNNNMVRVLVEQIPNSAISKPTVIIEENVSIVNNKLQVTIPWSGANDSYSITLGKAIPEMTKIDTDYIKNVSTSPTITPTMDEKVDVIFGKDAGKAATAKVEEKNNVKTTTVTLDDAAVKENLDKMDKANPNGNDKKVIISVNNNSNVVVAELNGQTVKNMQDKKFILEIKTENVSYTISVEDINIEYVSDQMGKQVELKDIKVSVTIAEASSTTATIVADSAKKNSYTVVVKPVEFEITCTSGTKTVNVSRFNSYVERTLAIPDDIDPTKITTGVVLKSDGTFSPVPTNIVAIDGKYYARISSLTNSTYTVIWNPIAFKDVEKHWAKDYINDVGSRLIDSGVGNGNFAPNRAITRGEFASMIVKALGLKGTAFSDRFSDVKKSDPYYQAIYTAYEYGIIAGYSNGKFGTQDLITRQQAMIMISNAMMIAGMDGSISETEIRSQLNLFKDSSDISSSAKQAASICIKYGIFGGSKGKLTPKGNITRAESATIIIRFLKKSGLI